MQKTHTSHPLVACITSRLSVVRMMHRNFETYKEEILGEIDKLDESLKKAPNESCKDGRAWQNRRKRKLQIDLEETVR